jgi:hypothetical protein
VESYSISVFLCVPLQDLSVLAVKRIRGDFTAENSEEFLENAEKIFSPNLT